MIIEEKPDKTHNRDWFSDRSRQLLVEQKLSWPLLGSNFANLDSVRTRDFEFDDFTIKVQFNADRMKSSIADVSKDVIANRECFLCLKNLPEEQNGISYNKKFIILANPYPIFPEHFTVSAKVHSPQTMIGHFEDLLNLSFDLQRDYTLFYNGPRCGSSAPDHLHFQAASRQMIPIETEYENLKNILPFRRSKNGRIGIWFFEKHLRYIIALVSGDKRELMSTFKTFLSVYSKISLPFEEPLMNIIAGYADGSWRIFIFPRLKHRPSHYFETGDSRLLISPAAVDMGGILITPREEDFVKISRDNVTEIFRQVTLPKEYFDFLRKKLTDL